jgi:hypothetical protein
MVKAKKLPPSGEGTSKAVKALRTVPEPVKRTAVLPNKGKAFKAPVRALKVVVLTTSGRYRVLAPAMAPKHVTAEAIAAAVKSLAR